MKSLQKAAEAGLLEAVKKIAELVNMGDDPTDAVVKVASERELSKGFLPLICSAYNTGVINAQRKSAFSILEKFADVPLADAKVAEERLFPADILTPAQLMAKTAVSEDYSRP